MSLAKLAIWTSRCVRLLGSRLSVLSLVKLPDSRFRATGSRCSQKSQKHLRSGSAGARVSRRENNYSSAIYTSATQVQADGDEDLTACDNLVLHRDRHDCL